MADFLMREEYVKVKKLCSSDFKSPSAGSAILEFVTVSLDFLNSERVLNCV